MRLNKHSFAIVSLLMGFSLAATEMAWGQTSPEDTKAAIDRVDQILQGASNGSDWRAYLKLSELPRLLSADKPNAAALRDILVRFQANSSYLDRPEFVAVRRILEQRLGEPSLLMFEELQPGIESAKQTYDAPDPEALQIAERQLATAFSALDKYLSPSSQRSGWRKYLKLEELNTNQASTIDLAQLEQVRRKLHNRNGRKLAPSVRLQDAIRKYQRIRMAREAGQAEYQAVLDRLAHSLDSYGKVVNADDDVIPALKVGQELAWLESRGQARQLVASIRRHWSRPNLYGHTSDYVIAKSMERSVAETNPIHENILGTDVHGTGTTYGTTKAKLVPNPAYATIDLLTSGTTYSNTVGYNSGASIFSTGTSQFSGSKRIFLTADGTYFWDAAVNVCTHSNPYCVDSGRGHGGFITRIANRVAWKRVGEGKPAAEAESSRIAEGKIKSRMNDEAAKRAAESREDFDKKYRLGLLDADAYPDLFRYSTTDKYVQMTQLQARSFELGAPDSPPAFASGSDLAVQIHETMVENYFRARYADKDMSEDEFRSEALLFMSKEKYEEQYSPDGTTTVKLDKDQPIVVRFRKGPDGKDGYSIKILGLFGTPAGSSRAEVGVEYVFERDETDHVVARRKRVPVPEDERDPDADPEELELYESISFQLFPKNQTKQTIMGRSIRNTFDKMFPREQKDLDPLQLSGDLKKAGPMRLKKYDTDGGWMVLSWNAENRATVQGPPAPPNR